MMQAEADLSETPIHVGVAIPGALQSVVERHQASLSALVASLRSAGIGEAMVEQSVRTLVDGYRNELTLAIRRMVDA